MIFTSNAKQHQKKWKVDTEIPSSVDFLVNFQLKSCGGDGIKSQFLVAWVVGICSPNVLFSSSKMHDWFLMLT